MSTECTHDECHGLCSTCAHDCGNDKEFIPTSVGVEEMAARREDRARRQQELLAEFEGVVVCFTMNIAGEIKHTPAIELCFELGVNEFLNAADEFRAKLLHMERYVASTGCEAFFVFTGIVPRLLKAVAVRIEDETDFGRLYDIDVFGRNGEKLLRTEPRRCLICKEPAFVCARSRTHSLGELKERTRKLTFEAAAYAAAQCAYDALVAEVRTTPKAGLVDLNNNGANNDMTVETFMAGAGALRPFYYAMAYAASSDEDARMSSLIAIGREAEASMLEATGGVNTHKGAIFCIGLLCSAVGSIAASGGRFSPYTILEEARRIANARPQPTDSSNGSAVRERFGNSRIGADAEARAGFPHTVNAYRCILGFRMAGFSDNDAYALALLRIMATLNDSNVYKRSGEEGAAFVRTRAEEILKLPVNERIGAVQAFDAELIERGINCGGAADVLAAAIFLDRFNTYIGA